MKVHKCNTAVATKPEPVKLSWYDMQKKEGVYKRANGGGSRFIVLKYSSITHTLIYSSNNKLEPASPSLWNDSLFIEVEGAQVCFDIKEGE